MLTNDIELKIHELEKINNSRCTKIYNENCQLFRKIKTLEEHQEMLRITIHGKMRTIWREMNKIIQLKPTFSGIDPLQLKG